MWRVQLTTYHILTPKKDCRQISYRKIVIKKTHQLQAELATLSCPILSIKPSTAVQLTYQPLKNIANTNITLKKLASKKAPRVDGIIQKIWVTNANILRKTSVPNLSWITRHRYSSRELEKGQCIGHFREGIKGDSQSHFASMKDTRINSKGRYSGSFEEI